MSDAPSLTEVATVGVWTGTVFGLAEGGLLVASRAWPVILAPYKASAHLLWIAPVVDVVIFVTTGIILSRALKFTGISAQRRALLLCWGWYLFLGIVTVAATLNVIHNASAVALALGAAMALSRRLSGREMAATRYLRRRILVAPLLIVIAAVAVTVHGELAERRRFADLPPVAEATLP
jgi:hypothetical protein